MRKETVITAVVFFGVGFLAGYIYDAQKNWNAQQKVASAGVPRVRDEMPGREAGAPDAASGATPQGLPQGHPSIETAAVVKALEEQATQNAKDPEPRLKLANYLYDQRQFQQAIEWYQKALELDPKNVNARTDLGTSFFNVGRPSDALREYGKSLETNPKHEPTMFNLIIVNLEGTHDLAAARAAWERLYKLNPNYPGLDRLKQSLDAAGASAPAAPARR